MRIFVWHGYLLAGTGSNIYARQLSREWSREGHDVTVFSQDSRPERFDLGGAAAVRPDVGGLLPVFVLDRYDGYEVKRVQDCSRQELDTWVGANAAALRDRGPADLVFANHVLLGGPVGAASGLRYLVKAHGSELEYSMRGNDALSAWGGEVLGGAEATIVGSAHIRHVVHDVCGAVDRIHEIPPGVDVDRWQPAAMDEALPQLIAEARNDPPNPGNAKERLPDQGNAERLAAFLAGDRPTVVYFGKLIENKGVQVLLEALRGLDARTVIVGFGDYRAPPSSSGKRPVSTRCSRAPSSTGTSCTSWRWRTRRSRRRSSPRRSGWWRPRRPPQGAPRSSQTTRGWPRSHAAWRRTTRPDAPTSRASRTAMPRRCATASRQSSR
jgi:glycosyltransferase involved in cell wall biosynthesis